MQHSILKKSWSQESNLMLLEQLFPNLFDHDPHSTLYSLTEFFGAEVGKFRKLSNLHLCVVMNLLWVSTKVRKALVPLRRISSNFPYSFEPGNNHLTQEVPSNILTSRGSPWMVPLRRMREWQLAMAAHSGPHGKALPEAKLWTSWKLVEKIIRSGLQQNHLALSASSLSLIQSFMCTSLNAPILLWLPMPYVMKSEP